MPWCRAAGAGVLPTLLARTGGENAAFNRSIVNVSSTSGAYIYSNIGQSGYAASKAALHMLTCHLAEEFAAFGLRANTLAPDSFPERVTTASVCDAIARVAAGDMNGRMLLLEPAVRAWRDEDHRQHGRLSRMAKAGDAEGRSRSVAASEQ